MHTSLHSGIWYSKTHQSVYRVRNLLLWLRAVFNIASVIAQTTPRRSLVCKRQKIPNSVDTEKGSIRMADAHSIDFFIGSNSGSGPVTYFDYFYHPDDMHTVYLIKGGPGGGKSTLMKRLAKHAENKGLSAEKIHCPSDPSSLDGLYIREKGLSLADATAPHVLEPRCHGALEQYLSLSPYVNSDAVRSYRKEAMALSEEIAHCHAAAKKRLAAADTAEAAIFQTVLPGINTTRLHQRGEALARRYLPTVKQAGTPRVYKRFLSGITPRGIVHFAHTPPALLSKSPAPTYVVLHDSYGLAPFMLGPVLEKAQATGQTVYACYDPLNPAKLEHLIFPALGLAFLSTPFGPPPGIPARNLRLDAAVDPELLKRHRNCLKALFKARQALIEEAVECLAEALKEHDKLESLYSPATNFRALDHLAESLSDRFSLA